MPGLSRRDALGQEQDNPVWPHFPLSLSEEMSESE